MRKSFFTGIQPTNSLHIGNYAGAILPMLELQKQGHNITIFVADMHSLTIENFPLHKKSLETAAFLYACGLSEENTVVFKQSDLGEYISVLNWIFSCFCPRGLLDRMAQMKDKSKSHGYLMGLYAYPVLMAADILILKHDCVPVGEDQKQHMELMKFLCNKMNDKIGISFFQEPQQYEHSVSKKIMSLNNVEKKMSKSGDNKDCIFLNDTALEIEKKIMKAKTDSFLFPTSQEEIIELSRKEINNLVDIFCLFSDVPRTEVFQRFGGKQNIEFKYALISLLQEKLAPIAQYLEMFVHDTSKIELLLKKNAQKLRPLYEAKITEIKNLFF